MINSEAKDTKGRKLHTWNKMFKEWESKEWIDSKE
jgi:hypothetical protein